MKGMGGLLRLLRWRNPNQREIRGQLNGPMLAGVIFLVLLVNVDIASCSKSIRTVDDKLSNDLSPHKKVPLKWSWEEESGSAVDKNKKPFPPSKELLKFSKECGKANSKLSSKCRKEAKKIEKEKLKHLHKMSGLSEKLKKGMLNDKYHSKFIKSHKQSQSSKHHHVIDIIGNSKNTPPEIPKTLQNVQNLTPDVILEINNFVRKKRHYCKLHDFEGWACQKLRLSTWLAKQMEKNGTKLSPWLEIVRRPDNETGRASADKRSSSSSSFSSSPLSKDLSDIQPDIWPEKIAYRLIKAWGDPEDLFVFYKYKDFIKSRELKISLPYKAELTVSPRTSNELEESARTSSSSSTPTYSLALGSGRFFWDPGFNLKLKLPFFRDELKVAVSTGPSFIAGIGVGITLLILKTMFAPFLLGMKWMVYNVFFKESSPFELMKMLFLSHAPESWESSPAIPPPAIEHYSPPPIRNHFEYGPGPGPMGRPPRPGPPPPHYHGHGHGHGPPFRHHSPYPRGPKGFRPPPPPPPFRHRPHHHSYEDYHQHAPFDLNHQYTNPTPMIQTLDDESPTMSQLEHLYRAQLLQGGMGLKRPPPGYESMMSPPHPTNSIDDGMDGPQEPQDSQSYIPSTGLQAEVEHFDPFYSPLLSKIDSIFTHLGHDDEGCRERVVCSIYKFPVKYAPYSNLLSAQLSKHQSELKRPVTSSAKILRYFRYMKAAKDGQGGANCVELYPKCGMDTDAVSSLPMMTTFHHLSELMTAESAPGVALATKAAG